VCEGDFYEGEVEVLLKREGCLRKFEAMSYAR
jgi:hypothetical protein